MILPVLALLGVTYAAVIPRDTNLKIVISNDDGWATANIRQFYNALKASNYNALISAPASNKSGSGSLEFPPISLLGAGEFGTIPSGAPGTGQDPNDPNIYYVNSFPATAMKYGIEEFAPQQLGGKPDLAFTGPNVGSNLGLINEFSGTVGAATKAISMGVPAIAFSGAGGTQHIFTEADPVANTYAQVSTKLVNAVVSSGAPYLPSGIGLNVNLPLSDNTTCTDPADFKFVLSSIFPGATTDATQCGSDQLPTESDVANAGGCYVSVSVFEPHFLVIKSNADEASQETVKSKLSSILACLPS